MGREKKKGKKKKKKAGGGGEEVTKKQVWSGKREHGPRFGFYVLSKNKK